VNYTRDIPSAFLLQVLVPLPTESSKMTATWKGPFRIVRKLSDVNYQVNVGARRGLVTYHINLFKNTCFPKQVNYTRDIPSAFLELAPLR
jgi:hypothetical protein